MRRRGETNRTSIPMPDCATYAPTSSACSRPFCVSRASFHCAATSPHSWNGPRSNAPRSMESYFISARAASASMPSALFVAASQGAREWSKKPSLS